MHPVSTISLSLQNIIFLSCTKWPGYNSSKPSTYCHHLRSTRETPSIIPVWNPPIFCTHHSHSDSGSRGVWSLSRNQGGELLWIGCQAIAGYAHTHTYGQFGNSDSPWYVFGLRGGNPMTTHANSIDMEPGQRCKSQSQRNEASALTAVLPDCPRNPIQYFKQVIISCG